MYYASSSLEEILKCSRCKNKLVNVVKSIPTCAHFICGDCYEILRDSLKSTQEFKCSTCDQLAVMPDGGLPDVEAIMNMLKLKPQEKALNSSCLSLKAAIEGTESKLVGLKSFDSHKKCQAYCDQLRKEIREAVANGVNHLNQAGESLLKMVDDYNDELLGLKPSAPKQPKMDKSGDAASVQDELATLTKSVEDLSTKWRANFGDISKAPSDSEVVEAKKQFEGLNFKINGLNEKLANEAFNNRFLRFRVNESLLKAKNCLGEIVCENSEQGNMTKLELLQTMVGHASSAVSAVFVDNVKLATGFKDGTIRIWNSLNGDVLFEFREHTDSVISLALLQDGSLASGSRDTTIKIWSLSERKSKTTFAGHKGPVISLKTLPSVKLASCSHDDTIKIWNPFSKSKLPLLSISGHGIKNRCMQLVLLSNSHLATCSDENDVTNTIRVWNTETGALVKSIQTGFTCAMSLLAVSGDQVAIFSKNGFITVCNLNENDRPKKICSSLWYSSFSTLQISMGYLVNCSHNPTDGYQFEILNLFRKQIIQTIPSGHASSILTLSMSPDGKILASASNDTSIKTWSISYQ